MSSANHEIFSAWLTAYGKAWEEKDEKAFAALFTPDALYYWTPHDDPKQGRNEIAAAFRCATSRQEDISFRFEILSVTTESGVAHWQCEFDRTPTRRRIHLDGIMKTSFSKEWKGREFHEWWHTDEPCAEIARTHGPSD